MPSYRVEINGRAYEGGYNTAANAVYGAMLKDEGEVQHECKNWRESQMLLGNTLGGKLVIYVEQIPPTTKKVHRVA